MSACYIICEMIAERDAEIKNLMKAAYREDDWSLQQALAERRALQNALSRLKSRGVN